MHILKIYCNFAEMIISKVMEKKEKKEWKDFKFNLFGTTWKVHFIKHLEREDGTSIYGWCNEDDCTILVALGIKDKTLLSKERVELTLLHEIIHAICDTGKYEITNDEHFVEWTARCLNSLIKQNILKYAKE